MPMQGAFKSSPPFDNDITQFPSTLPSDENLKMCQNVEDTTLQPTTNVLSDEASEESDEESGASDCIDRQHPCDYLWTDEDWESLGYFDWPNREPPDLTAAFQHPVMKQSSGFWGTDEEYALIQPAIKIASRLLMLPKTSLFVYALVYECKPLPSQFNFNGHPCFQFRMSAEKGSDLCVTEVTRIWETLSSYNEWGPSPPSEDYMFEDGTQGFCDNEYHHGGATAPGPDLRGDGMRG